MPDQLARLDAIEARLFGGADREGLAAPDPTTGDQWEAGQVWGHVNEFVPYWSGQIQTIIAARSPAPLPLGRDEAGFRAHAASIARGKTASREAQIATLRAELAQLRAFLSSLSEEDRQAQGQTDSLGVMTVDRMIDAMILTHLEEHADQLAILTR